MYSVLNTLSEYTCFYISKDITSQFFCLFLKSWKAFSVPLIISLTDEMIDKDSYPDFPTKHAI